MGKSHCHVTKEQPCRIVAAFTLSNGSIHNRLLTSSAKKQLTGKRYHPDPQQTKKH